MSGYAVPGAVWSAPSGVKVDPYDPAFNADVSTTGAPDKPAIYLFSNSRSGDGIAYAMAEDGHVLGSHLCSHWGYMRHDLHDRPDRKAACEAHYPDGYQLVILGPDEVPPDDVLERNRALAEHKEQAMGDIDVEATVETLGPIGLPVHEVTQTILADPERKHVHGNCLQAAVASIFGLPLEAVPSFVQFTWWEGALKLWARGYGVDPQWHEGSEPPQGLALVLGTSPRGFGHAVVGLAGEILFDPHPSRDGLTAIETAVTFPSWLHGDSKCWACNTPHDVRAELARLRSVVAGVEALAAEGVEVVLDDHWLTVDGNPRIVGCHCGFRAAPDDCGYGDSVLAHLAEHFQRRLRSVLSDTRGEAQ